jgi:hypothetical protein
MAKKGFGDGWSLFSELFRQLWGLVVAEREALMSSGTQHNYPTF